VESKRTAVPTAFSSDPHARRYYRAGYRDGLHALGRLTIHKRKLVAYDAGYDAGLAAREAKRGRGPIAQAL